MPEQQPGMRITRQIAVAGHYAYIFKNYAYTTFSETGWQVMDVSDPTAPIGKNARINYRGQYQTWGQSAAVTYGGYTFLTAKSSGLRVLDVTSTDSPTEVDSFGVSGNIMDVAVDSKGYIYAASDQSGLYVLHYDGDGGK
jgi:hypothetical protein